MRSWTKVSAKSTASFPHCRNREVSGSRDKAGATSSYASGHSPLTYTYCTYSLYAHSEHPHTRLAHETRAQLHRDPSFTLLLRRDMSMETTYIATLKPSDLGFEVPQMVIIMSEYGGGGIRTVPSFSFLTRVKGNPVPAFLQLVFYFCLPCTGLFDSEQTCDTLRSNPRSTEEV